jgi:hypothetical protein
MMNRSANTTREPLMLRTVCLAAGLVLAPMLAHSAPAGWLVRPLRPRSAAVTAALATRRHTGRAAGTRH